MRLSAIKGDCLLASSKDERSQFMRIPGAKRAVIDPDKIRDYLLSELHPVGRFKARFFGMLGFRRAEWQRLAEILEEIAQAEAVSGKASAFGQKFEVHATLTGPSGRSAGVVVVWIVRLGENFPRFVTAYPGVK